MLAGKPEPTGGPAYDCDTKPTGQSVSVGLVSRSVSQSVRSVGQLVGWWSVSQLVGWWVDQSVGWLVGQLVGQVSQPVEWQSVGRLVGQSGQSGQLVRSVRSVGSFCFSLSPGSRLVSCLSLSSLLAASATSRSHNPSLVAPPLVLPPRAGWLLHCCISSLATVSSLSGWLLNHHVSCCLLPPLPLYLATPLLSRPFSIFALVGCCIVFRRLLRRNSYIIINIARKL